MLDNVIGKVFYIEGETFHTLAESGHYGDNNVWQHTGFLVQHLETGTINIWDKYAILACMFWEG